MVWIFSSTTTLLTGATHHSEYLEPSPLVLSAGCRPHRCGPLYCYFCTSKRELYESNALVSGLEADAFPLGETPVGYCLSV